MLLAKKEAKEEELWRVLEQVNLKNEIQNFSEGLDTILGENATRLSGGQRQRLALAQALLKEAKVILLDEPSSALDKKNTELLMEFLNTIKNHHTILITCHNQELKKYADHIIEL